ncbi:MAG: hypothetical protein P8Y65_08575 [Campylobacterales bacterium]
MTTPARWIALPVLASSLLFSAALSQASSDTSLVIYNSGVGLVHETRSLTVDAGEQSIVYPGVATTVQTDSVNVRLPKGLTLYSQQYRFDKITLGKIIEAHIGKKVRYKTGPVWNRTLRDGILLAADPAVVKTDRGIESGIPAEVFLFESIPDTLIMKPSLVWNIKAEKKTRGEMTLDYLLSKIRWKSDYTQDLGKEKGNLTGWITVDNRSGKRFDAIRLKLLAGDINRAAPVRYADVMAIEKTPLAGSVSQTAHEGYHLYSVPFKVTIADNEKTQIKFTDRPDHPLRRLYEVTMQPPFSASTERKRPVIQSVELSGFDIPLPGGIVRTYSDADGTRVLLGESRLDNTPKNEKVTLHLGTNFDLVAKNRLISRGGDSRYREATVGYVLANRSDARKGVDVIVPGVIEKTDRQTTVTSGEPYTRPDGYSLRFRFMLDAGETKTWEATYRTRKE